MKCFPNAKKPAMQHGVNDATHNADYMSWHKDGFNIGLAMRQNGLIAIDVDISKGKTGYEDLAELEKLYGKLPATLTQLSASGGLHLIFSNKGIGDKTVGTLTKSIDIRDKAYVLVEPSTCNGGKYKFINGVDEFGNITLAELPENWLNLINKTSIIKNKRNTTEYTIKPQKYYLMQNLNINKVINKCNFLCYCRDNAENLSENEWFSMISILAHIKDSDSVIHELSMPYLGYKYKETQYKIDRARQFGYPQSCEYISRNFSGICGNCVSNKYKKDQ